MDKNSVIGQRHFKLYKKGGGYRPLIFFQHRCVTHLYVQVLNSAFSNLFNLNAISVILLAFRVPNQIK